MFFSQSSSRQEASLQLQIQDYQQHNNTIPLLISLIWIGSDVPDTESHPYLTNLKQHKLHNPEATVQLFICQKLMSEAARQALETSCRHAGIDLRDIETTCQQYLNLDLIQKLLANTAEVQANAILVSDLLRLSILYHEGGYYYDTDLQPIAPIDRRNAKFGFWNYYKNDRAQLSPHYCFHAAVPKHPLYLHQAAVSRFLYEALIGSHLQKTHKPSWLTTSSSFVRYHLTCIATGNPLTCLANFSTLKNCQVELYEHSQYPLEENCHVQFDSSWLDNTEAGETNTDSDTLTSLMRYYYSIIRQMQMGDYFFQQKSAKLFATLALQSPTILYRR